MDLPDFDSINGEAENENLRSARGVKFRETVVSEITTYAPKRHFGVKPSGNYIIYLISSVIVELK